MTTPNIEEVKNKILLSPADVAVLLGVTTNTLRRRRSSPNFPAPIRLGPRLLKWARVAIDEYLASDQLTQPNHPTDRR